MEEGPINPWVISLIPEGRQIEPADLLNLGFNPQDNELGLENLKEAYEVLTNVQKKRVLPAYNVLKILQRALRNSIGKEMQITNKMAELGIDLGTLRWLSDNEKVDTSDKLLKDPVDAREDILVISNTISNLLESRRMEYAIPGHTRTEGDDERNRQVIELKAQTNNQNEAQVKAVVSNYLVNLKDVHSVLCGEGNFTQLWTKAYGLRVTEVSKRKHKEDQEAIISKAKRGEYGDPNLKVKIEPTRLIEMIETASTLLKSIHHIDVPEVDKIRAVSESTKSYPNDQIKHAANTALTSIQSGQDPGSWSTFRSLVTGRMELIRRDEKSAVNANRVNVGGGKTNPGQEQRGKQLQGKPKGRNSPNKPENKEKGGTGNSQWSPRGTQGKGTGQWTGNYPGECYNCGVYGHTARFCRNNESAQGQNQPKRDRESPEDAERVLKMAKIMTKYDADPDAFEQWLQEPKLP